MQAERYHDALRAVDPIRLNGRVEEVVGLVIESRGPRASLGEVCLVYGGRNAPPIRAEVVGFRAGRVLLMPLADIAGVAPGSEVIATGAPLRVPVGDELLGRVLDGLGQPIDGRGDLRAMHYRAVSAEPPSPLRRRRVHEPLETGVRAIDALLTCGKGQRMGIFSGSGVGKSVLLGMLARSSRADVNVIALIGERGREVREFVERDLGGALKRSVVVTVTSDQSPLVRVKGAMGALAIAEAFRDAGLDVLFMMDSVTRFAMAQRELGLAVGEPPATKGYTPSVYALLPRLLERAGMSHTGSITGMFTVYVEADDLNDPIADTVRSILDGHVVLSRRMAMTGHYPAIDVLESVSRVMMDVAPPEHLENARRVVEVLARHRDAEDLLAVGAYARGANAKTDRAIEMIDDVRAFLRQPVKETSAMASTLSKLSALATRYNA
ncbi:MAG: FliI/YscN family ATPase [bacterium]